MTDQSETYDLRVGARTKRLTAAADGDDGDAWRFGGVAVGEGDILYADDGTPFLFDDGTLAAYAETQAGEPLSVDHPTDDSGEPIYPPPVENSPGKVLKAGYVPGQGLVYEARTHDEEIAKGIKAGNYEVSVHPTLEAGEKDPETGAYIPKNVDFKDLSIVTKGMSASNTAEWGPTHALAKWTETADIGAELDAATADADGDAETGVSQGAIRAAVQGTLDALGISTGDRTDILAQEDRTPQVGDAVRWESEAGGEREPADVRYGVIVDGLEDDPEERVLVAVYEPTADGDGWENRGEQNPMNRENLEVVGTDGVESLPPVSQVTAAAAADASTGNEPAESGADADSEPPMADEEPDQTDEQTEEEQPEEEQPDEREESTVVEVDIGEHDDFESFMAAKIKEVTAESDKAEKVDEIIASSDDFDEDDREALMASADSLVNKYHEEATREVTASLPGAAGGRSATVRDDDDRDAYGTGVSGDL